MVTVTKTFQDMHVRFRACYPRQRFGQLVSQRLNKVASQVARKTAKCNSTFKELVGHIILHEKLQAASMR